MNIIPTIHVKDLVSLVKRILLKKPLQKYILAVDRTYNKSLKSVMTAISSCVGNGKVKAVGFERENEHLSNVYQLLLNAKFVTSKVFDDRQADDEDDTTFNKRKFPWVAEVKYSIKFINCSLELKRMETSFEQSLWNTEG